METINDKQVQPEVNQNSPPETGNLTADSKARQGPIWRKLLPLLFSILILLMAIAALIITVFSYQNRGGGQVTPSPGDFSQTRPISEFAKTPEFMKFEKDINELKSETENLDLTENQLSFPALDMNVNFKN